MNSTESSAQFNYNDKENVKTKEELVKDIRTFSMLRNQKYNLHTNCWFVGSEKEAKFNAMINKRYLS